MPTEHRSSNTEMVSVPRELTEEMRKAWQSAPQQLDSEWAALLAAAPIEQHQVEPYGWVQTRGDAINHFTQEWDVVQEWEDQGFKFKAMHDRPGEIERLRAEVKRLDLMVAQADFNYDSDRHQFQRDLADRDALLQGWMNIPRAASSPEMNDLRRKTDYLLSASAEQAQNLAAEVDKQRHLKMLVADKLQNALDNCSAYRHHLDEALVLAEKVRDAIPGMKRKYLGDLIVYLYQNAKGDCPPASTEPSKNGNTELSGAEPVAPSWACQQCKLEQPTARPCDVCGGPAERDESGEMKDALRAFVGAAYPVALQINKRGHNWS